MMLTRRLQVVETLGFNRTIGLVLTCPPYLIAGIISIYWSWQSGKYNERTWHITTAKALAVTGFVLGCATLNTGAKYFAMVVFSVGTYAVNSIVLGWVASTCGQTKQKKASSLAIVNTIANVSFIWTPYLWPDSDAPRYTIAMSSSGTSSSRPSSIYHARIDFVRSCFLYCHRHWRLGDALLAQAPEQEDPPGFRRVDPRLCVLSVWARRAHGGIACSERSREMIEMNVQEWKTGACEYVDTQYSKTNCTRPSNVAFTVYLQHGGVEVVMVGLLVRSSVSNKVEGIS